MVAFSTFKIEMVPEFDDRGNVNKFLRDVRHDMGQNLRVKHFFFLCFGQGTTAKKF